jgi:hypothetical protein
MPSASFGSLFLSSVAYPNANSPTEPQRLRASLHFVAFQARDMPEFLSSELTGNRLLYGLCMRLAGVCRAKCVRSDNFGSTPVQRLNAGERNSPSLIGGFLGRLGKT